MGRSIPPALAACKVRGLPCNTEDVPIPEPGLGEVVVRIRSCGICATGYKAIKGLRRNVTFLSIPGYELNSS